MDLSDFKPVAPSPTSSPTSTPENPTPGCDNPDTPSATHGSVAPSSTTETPTEHPAHNEMDAYKGLSTVERGIVRKVLSVINSMTDIPDRQKQKLKNKLQKKIVKK